MAVGWDSDDNMSLAGLTQETQYVDVTTINSDDEPIDPHGEFQAVTEGTHKLSSSFLQVFHFDDKIFAISHRST